jgi:hypothetical protein
MNGCTQIGDNACAGMEGASRVRGSMPMNGE